MLRSTIISSQLTCSKASVVVWLNLSRLPGVRGLVAHAQKTLTEEQEEEEIHTVKSLQTWMFVTNQQIMTQPVTACMHNISSIWADVVFPHSDSQRPRNAQTTSSHMNHT